MSVSDESLSSLSWLFNIIFVQKNAFAKQK